MAAFRDNLFFCSNFCPSPIIYKGVTYPTAEHFYQACKCSDIRNAMEIIRANTPGKAKRLGAKVHLRPDWNEVKLDVMRHAVKLKFEQNPTLMDLLRKTGKQYLCEENEWGDRFWGKCGGVGENWLGRILMELRDTK